MAKVKPREIDESRRTLFRGLAALLPTLLTIALLLWAYRLVNDSGGAYITEGMVWMLSSLSPEPPTVYVDPVRDALRYGEPINEWDSTTGRRLTVEYRTVHNGRLREMDPDRFARERGQALWHIAARKYQLHLLGFLIAIVVVYFVGYFLASFIGRTVWRAVESILYRIPLIRAIYPNVKQVTDFLLSERKVEFSGVVVVQYPRKGVWSLALLTGPPMKTLQQAVPHELITVFVPSSPTPFTGYTIQVPREDVIEINMTIDEALRFTISAGVIKSTTPLLAPDAEAGDGIAASSGAARESGREPARNGERQ